MTRRASVLAIVALVVGAAAAAPAAAQQNTCHDDVTRTYTDRCGPTFVLPGWGDAGGWTDPEQYETIQLADVDGDGKDELLARTPAGLAIHFFDTTLGQWRPQTDGEDRPAILTDFADPPPLTTANPNPPVTDWRLPQYYDTILAANIDGVKGEEIVARAASGLIAFKFTPSGPGKGSWQRLRDSDAFSTGFDDPSYYTTLQAGDLDGNGKAELLARQKDGITVVEYFPSWPWFPRAKLEFLADPEAKNPAYYTSLQVARLGGGRQDYLVGRNRDGISAFRLRGTAAFTPVARFASAFADDHEVVGADCPFVDEPRTCFGAGPAYYGTIQFADIDGDGREELLGRASDGLRVRRYQGDTADAWGRLPTLTDLSDANGYTDQKYWETIQAADIDGDRREEVLARDKDGLNAWSYDRGTRKWTKLAPSTPLALADDPWGSDRSYYSTIETGDVDGDGHHDVIARGPYGIRTWFYNRRGTGGWERYLSEGYPAFRQTAAFNRLNSELKAAGHIPKSAATVRDYWSRATPPTADELSMLRAHILTAANCATPSGTPPRSASCTPPADCCTADDWTTVANQVLAEAYWAEEVVDHFAVVTTIREALFIQQAAKLPAIGADLGLQVAEQVTVVQDARELFGSIVGIAGSIAGLIPEVGEALAADLEITAEVMSMLPSATKTLTERFNGTYSDLEKAFSDGIAEVDQALDEHSQHVRQDQALLELIGQLRSVGTWTLDGPGMKSAGRLGFATYVYKTLLPAVYARYVISECRIVIHNPPNCSGPSAGTPGVLGSPPVNFTALGPLAVPDRFPTRGSPCYSASPQPPVCDFDHVPGDIVDTVLGKLSPGCTYNGDADTEWNFKSCKLGVDPQKSIAAAPVASEDWAFDTYTGAYAVWARDSASLVGRANAVGRAGTLRLTGSVTVPRRLRLDRARVLHDRVVYERDGAGELARRASGRRLTPVPLSRRRRLEPLVFASQRRRGSVTRLQLKQTSRRSLSFALRVSGVRLALPTACSGTRPGVDLASKPIALHTRLRIDDGRARPIVLSLKPQWECQRNRLGSVHRFVVRKPTVRAPSRRGLAVTVRGSRRAAPGRLATYRITIRNRSATPAYDTLVHAFVPRGLTARRARSPRVTWRYVRLPPHSSKTKLLRVRVAPSAAGRKVLRVGVQAIDTRAAGARHTIRIRP